MTTSEFEDTLSPEDVSDEFFEREEDLDSDRLEEVLQCFEKPRNGDAMVPWLRDEEGTLISLDRRIAQPVRPNSPRLVALRGPLQRRRKNLSVEVEKQDKAQARKIDKLPGHKDTLPEREQRASKPTADGKSGAAGNPPRAFRPTGGVANAPAPAPAPPCPARFRRLPRFVGVARRVNWPAFALIVTFFFDHQRWPRFDALPRAFRDFCRGAHVTAADADELPGFAPEWLFHVREMDARLFWSDVVRFFVEGRFASWEKMPAEYTAWLRTLNVREFDYPPGDTLGVRTPSHVYMDRRLMLTKKEGPKNRKYFPATEDLIRGVMHSLKFE